MTEPREEGSRDRDRITQGGGGLTTGSPSSPVPDSGFLRFLRRLLLVSLILTALLQMIRTLEPGRATPMNGARLELPPDQPGVLVHGTIQTDLSDQDPRLLEIIGAIRAAPDSLEAAARISRWLRQLRGKVIELPTGDWRRLPVKPLDAGECLKRVECQDPVDRLSVSWLTARLLTRANWASRLVIMEEAARGSSRGMAGVEIWHPMQHSWILVDPAIGVIFSDASRHLSALDVRRRLIERGDIWISPLVNPVPASTDGAQIEHYRSWNRNLRYPASLPATSQEFSRTRWLLVDDDLASLWTWTVPLALTSLESSLLHLRFAWLRDWLSSLFLMLFMGYGVLVLAQAVRLRRLGGMTGASLDGMLRRDLVWMIGGTRARLRSLYARLGHRARLEVSLFSASPTGIWLSSAAVSGARLFHRYIRHPWLRSQARLAQPRPVAGAVIGLCLLVAVCLYLVQLIMFRPECDEDAYITFRFARNLAEGQGITFNPGEPGVEGFSTMLWMLILAAVHHLSPHPPENAVLIGMGLAAVQMIAVGLLALRAGAYGASVLLVFVTIPSWVGVSASGMETSLVGLLMILVTASWMTEDDRGPGSSGLTALACWLLAVARAEGWYLFLGITAFRLLSGWGSVLDRARLRVWFGTYGLLFGGYTAWRVFMLGSLVPHIYGSRLVEQRGDLLHRMPAGLTYVASTLLANPALLLAMFGLVVAWRNRESARCAAVILLHLTMVVLAGGDAHHMSHSRFLMPVAGLLVLQLQHLLQQAARGRGVLRRWDLLVLLLAILSNGTTDRFPGRSDGRGPGPLGMLFTLDAADRADRFKSGLQHMEFQRYNTLRSSFDGKVAMHMVNSLQEGELASGQAGQFAYVWPGKFRDYVGLATAKPTPHRYEPTRCGGPDYYLLFPDHLSAHWQRLARAGFHFERCYVQADCGENEEPEYYALLTRHPGNEFPLDKLPVESDGGLIQWWRLPPSRVVLFTREFRWVPLLDGTTMKADPKQLWAIPRETRELIRRSWPAIFWRDR